MSHWSLAFIFLFKYFLSFFWLEPWAWNPQIRNPPTDDCLCFHGCLPYYIEFLEDRIHVCCLSGHRADTSPDPTKLTVLFVVQTKHWRQVPELSCRITLQLKMLSFKFNLTFALPNTHKLGTFIFATSLNLENLVTWASFVSLLPGWSLFPTPQLSHSHSLGGGSDFYPFWPRNILN
jgi:hypothetical protein